jgi:hypothetical protein
MLVSTPSSAAVGAVVTAHAPHVCEQGSSPQAVKERVNTEMRAKKLKAFSRLYLSWGGVSTKKLDRFSFLTAPLSIGYCSDVRLPSSQPCIFSGFTRELKSGKNAFLDN